MSNVKGDREGHDVGIIMSRSHSRHSFQSSARDRNDKPSSRSIGSTKHSRKNRSKHPDTSLHKLKKNVSHMVSDDRKHKNEVDKHEEVKCQCPSNCDTELTNLREYILKQRYLLRQYNKPLNPLNDLAELPERLLTETWTIIGPSKLKDLISEDILAVCARRERRGLKHPSLLDSQCSPGVAPSTPPFTCLEPESGSLLSTPGAADLWRRCLDELHELTPQQISSVLSGSSEALSIPTPQVKLLEKSGNNIPEKDEEKRQTGDFKDASNSSIPVFPTDSTSQSMTAECSSSKQTIDPVESPVTIKSLKPAVCTHVKQEAVITSETATRTIRTRVSDSQTCDSTAKEIQARVQKEVTELEMRARAIRSMLKPKA